MSWRLIRRPYVKCISKVSAGPPELSSLVENPEIGVADGGCDRLTTHGGGLKTAATHGGDGRFVESIPKPRMTLMRPIWPLARIPRRVSPCLRSQFTSLVGVACSAVSFFTRRSFDFIAFDCLVFFDLVGWGELFFWLFHERVADPHIHASASS